METYLNGIEDHCDRKIARTEVSRKENLQNTKKTTNEQPRRQRSTAGLFFFRSHQAVLLLFFSKFLKQTKHVHHKRTPKKKPPAIPECLTIQKQKRTNNNSSKGITGAIRDDNHGGEKEREIEWGRARVEGRKTEALNWSSGRPLLSRCEGPGPWLVRRAANKNDKDGGR